MKRCSKCRQILPREMFSHHRSRKDGYHNQCKSCRSLSNKASYAKHREQLLHSMAVYRAGHREENRQRQRLYYASHQDKYHQYFLTYRSENLDRIRQRDVAYNATRQEKRRQYFSTYNAAHPERARNYSAKRRALLKNAPHIESIALEVLATRDNWHCHICGKKVTRAHWSRDHLIPLSKGGDHTYKNVALSHRRCNSKRGTGRIAAQLRLLS